MTKQEHQCTGQHHDTCANTVGGSTSQGQCPAYSKMCAECSKVGHFWKVFHSRRSRVINEMDQEVSQEYTGDVIEMVSVNSVYMNKNQSVLNAKLETCICNNNMIIPCNIDVGSDSNIIPWYIFKKLFPRVTESQLTKTIKNHIKLKTYNKTFITQLGMCIVIITYKNNKKKCEFFVVPRNGQALLGMPDTAALNIINVNIDPIEAADTQKENCNTNISDAKTSNVKQEMHGAKESCTNTDEDLKSTNNGNMSDSNTNTTQ